MKIRLANEKDIESMVKLDKECFGDYGAKKDYFSKKLKNPSGNIIIAYDDKGKIIGFAVFEILEKDIIPEDFCDLKIKHPIKGRWVHMVAFTTKDNYKDKKSDWEILSFAEEFAKNKGCTESYVPLSKEHPLKQNGVFEFWKNSGYENVGEIKWIASPNELIECFFYRKSL